MDLIPRAATPRLHLRRQGKSGRTDEEVVAGCWIPPHARGYLSRSVTVQALNLGSSAH